MSAHKTRSSLPFPVKLNPNSGLDWRNDRLQSCSQRLQSSRWLGGFICQPRGFGQRRTGGAVLIQLLFRLLFADVAGGTPLADGTMERIVAGLDRDGGSLIEVDIAVQRSVQRFSREYTFANCEDRWREISRK
jgi:hypothetical protein